MEKIKQTLYAPVGWWRSQLKRVKIGSILIIGIILFVIFGKNNGDDTATIETARRQTLSRTVLASGTVVSSTDLSLSFESPKMIDTVRVSVGDVVKKGAILATQKNGTERASYNAARGAVLAAEARYNKVLDGSSNEEIALAQTALTNAKRVQDGLVENARRTLNSQGLVAEPENSTVTNTPIISGTYTGPEGEYRLEPDIINGKKIIVTGLEKTTASISATSPQPLGTKGLNIIFPNRDDFSQGEGWTITIPNTASSVYVSNLSAYNAAKDARDAAVSSAEAELNLKRATARQPEIDAALADIVSAQAQLDQAAAALEKTILRAPADGTITKVSIKVGEVPEAMKEAIVIQDVSNLYLESNINESQISDISVGQEVTVTFDALDGKKYGASVSSVDPAATITDNIVNYKMKALLNDITDIKPGMTADVLVVTKEVPNVLVVPFRALTVIDGKYYADKIIDERRRKTQEVLVTIGIRGDGDMVEIVSGLGEGDKILWKTKNGAPTKN